jgi:hypothetical protein
MGNNNITLKPEKLILENGKIIGAKIADQIYYIPEWERKQLVVLKNYIIGIAYKKFANFVNSELYFDIATGEIKKENPYWEEKLFFNKNTVIKKIRHSLNDKDIRKIPLGKKIRANIYLFLETNKRNKYIQRMVFEIYITHANPDINNEEEIRIENREGKNCLFKTNLPNLSSFNSIKTMYINTY